MLVICIKLDKNNITVNNVLKCKMKHISGLPIANRMICNIIYSDNDIAFTAGNMKFKLQNSKIQDISLTNDTEIIKQTHYASSAGGAVAGGLLFGPIGALIGGRTKKKKHTSYNATNYLVITYKNNDDEISYIEFETRFSPGDAKKIVKKFKHNNANSKSEIEL